MPTMKGYIFIGLNVVRALSIVALLLLFASSIVTMVHDVQSVNAFIAAGKADPNIRAVDTNATDPDCITADTDYVNGSTVPNQPAGAFWAVLNRLLIIFQVIVLIMSEVGWPAAFFNRFFPILGDDFGLGALGVIQCLLGAAVLSHHVDEFSLVSAFLLFSLGCVNILLGLIFRESVKWRRSITSWREQDKNTIGGKGGKGGILPTSQVPRPLVMSSGSTAAWEKEQEAYGGADASRSGSLNSQKSGMGFGRQGEKAALARGFTISRPVEALPTYIPKSIGSKRASTSSSVGDSETAV
ncbi:hypothetical protein L226DRAFT_533176 [Lentinus tigrinus ALCF2SS1-7]|uniref:DUF7598 domain-containing protein n=1 Tax=Lentinus tigrinus ALCF2SS1-6 TaxID=1328759 RepID=A0A5C2SHS5_9APHY|nr:hypothetical protein L227DRAFT_572472 [Lentinus tigrinus ALCF2SS1-6]RPD77176.1 hypothetical protein L226DRAFT_533176 [Lentinus tigrinus ALCF2SS1-7]